MSAPAPRASAPFPGSALAHPLVLGAVALLLLNDHVFKARWPSWWTGKLSDVAGLAMFPLLLQALWEQARARLGRGFHPSRQVLVTCVLLTGLCFCAINVSVDAGRLWQWALGGLQWPVRVAWALVTGGRVPGVSPVAHTVDVPDLLTLPALLVALRVGWHRCAAPAVLASGALRTMLRPPRRTAPHAQDLDAVRSQRLHVAADHSEGAGGGAAAHPRRAHPVRD